jgi:hypothetical protein
MKHQNLSTSLKKIPNNLHQAFSPLYRIESLTGFAGYGIIIDGAIKNNGKEIIAGLIISGLSGLYGAYKDGCFSKINKSPKSSDLEDSLE